MKSIAIFMALSVLAYVSASTQSAPTPPGQPESGPGGSDYVYEDVRVTAYGERGQRYWIFEPNTAEDEIEQPLPVVAFLHGLNATDPTYFRGWINHLVRQGAIVIYPIYQPGGIEKPSDYTPNALAAMLDAIPRLDGQTHALADTERFAMVGHSLGGTIIANLAASYETSGLPRPRAMMSLMPGDTRAPRGLGAFLPSLVEDHRTLHEDLLMLVIACADDQIVGDSMAKRIFNAAQNVPDQNKSYLVCHSDAHGDPELVADHFTPGCPVDPDGNVYADAMDYKLWSLFDALTDAAFNEDSELRDYALGDTPQQRAIGQWSDGTPVRELTVVEPAE